MVSTCSRPFNDVLKIFTAPEWTTNKPGQGFPSAKMISPLLHLLGMEASARDCSASSWRCEKKETLFSVAMRSAFSSIGGTNALYRTLAASAPEKCFQTGEGVYTWQICELSRQLLAVERPKEDQKALCPQSGCCGSPDRMYGSSFQQQGILRLHRRANGLQDPSLHLRSLLGQHISFVAWKQDSFFLADVSFERGGKLAKQGGQLHAHSLPQPCNQRRETTVLTDQLLDSCHSLFNPAHGWKHDFLFNFEMGFQITLEETDHFISTLTEPAQIGLIRFQATLNS